MNNTFIDNAEDIDIVMLTYNLLEYSDNYSMTSGSLWNYYRDEVNDDENENDNANNNRINNNKIITSQFFVVPLRYLSNFWRFLDLPLINCKVELDLSWSKECIPEISITPRIPANPDVNLDANLPVQEIATIQTTGVRLLATCRAELSAVIACLLSMCLWSRCKW